MTNGKIFLVGVGPGAIEHFTTRAREAIEESGVIVGYSTYIELVSSQIAGKEIISTGMTEEIDRAKASVEKASQGQTVSVVSSGDSGIYGMAGLVYEVLFERGWKPAEDGQAGGAIKTGVIAPDAEISVEVVPGVTAMTAIGALLGAPIMHDFASISMSDLLTPWPVIEKRMEAAAAADFVIGIYNPQSKRRNWQLKKAREILLKYRKPETPVGIIKSAYRSAQNIVLTTLADMCTHEIGMLTTILVGNSHTFARDGVMVTPRGYENKYVLETGEVLEGQKPGISLRLNS